MALNLPTKRIIQRRLWLLQVKVILRQASRPCKAMSPQAQRRVMLLVLRVETGQINPHIIWISLAWCRVITLLCLEVANLVERLPMQPVEERVEVWQPRQVTSPHQFAFQVFLTWVDQDLKDPQESKRGSAMSLVRPLLNKLLRW